MLGDSSGGGGGGEAVVAAAAAGAVPVAGGGGGGGSTSGDDERRMEEGERSFGGNRWPRQETLALLRIRSDMDVAFRDASVKGPLWEEVSRKLAELGYQRSAKKCKEKFENVYKYHKRTKEGRSGKSEGKTYRFFDQLEALDHLHHSSTTQSNIPSKPPHSAPPPSLQPTSAATTTATTVPMPMPQAANTNIVPHVTVPSTTTITNTTMLPIAMSQGIVITANTPSMNLSNIPSFPSTNPTNFPPPPPPTTTTTNPTTNATIPISFPNIPDDLLSNSTNSSSSTSSDEIMERRRKRKRKWEDFFENLMKEVVKKNEEQQRSFLEAIEKREHDRMVREEAWRAQEMLRINKEREILAQERSMAAAKDAAVMAFLQKIAEQQNGGQALNTIVNVQSQPQPQPQPQSQPVAPPAQPQATVVSVVQQQQPQLQQQPQPQPQLQLVVQPGPPIQPVVGPPPQHQVTNMEIVKADNNGENMMMGASSSRWPKAEVEALIKLRTELDAKYQENGPKGPLWEEISSLMRKLGYNRNAKRCKEKWENINKYFKKVKESNKKRPQDSKTCPYFHQLDALYKEKNSRLVQPESTPLMVQPEQQWPPQQQQREEEDNDEDDGEEEEEEDEGSGGEYEIVAASKGSGVVGGASGQQ